MSNHYPLTNTILNQLGLNSPYSAIEQTNGTQIVRSENNGQRPIRPSKLVERPNGICTLDAEISVSWRVHTDNMDFWMMHVALEPNDTYTVRLLSINEPNRKTINLLGEQADTLGRDLSNVCIYLYQEALNKERT